MNIDFQQLMARATELTRQGDLQAATAAIQVALQRGIAPPAPAAGGEVIDVEVVDRGVMPDEAPSPAPAPHPTPRPASAPTAGAGRVETGRHAEGQAARDHRLFVPPQAGTRPLPLVVMLHGCTQDADDFAAGTAMNDAARTQGFFVLYPEQSAQMNPQRCWNWFKHSHQQRGRGEPALVAGMVRAVMAAHDIDPARVYVAGLSAGGAMAAILGDCYPDLFSAVGVHSGLAAGAARDLPGALAAMRQGPAPSAGGRSAAGRPGVPTIVFHGDADATVHPDNAHHVVAASTGPNGTPGTAEHVQGPGLRGSTRRVYRDADGQVQAEHWTVHGAPHAWSGGTRRGSFTDPTGPDATAEMLRFFFEHPKGDSVG